jgi:integrase
MTKLRQTVDNYLQIRRTLGFKLERDGRLLPDFISFLEQHNAPHITSDLALQWATAPSNTTIRWWADRLAIVRQFARFVSAIDSDHEVPAKDLLPQYRSAKLVPYVYSDDDIKCLMHKADRLYGLKAETYSTLFGLLYTTGMRVGEVIALNNTDINWQQGVLTIHHAKFSKSRQLPLHPSTTEVLRQYADIRDSSVCPRSPSFLLSLAGTRLHYKNVHETFLSLIRDTYLNDQQPHRPRIHDLRHTFAIKTLTRWYQEDLDVDALLPSLSTYLGHVSPSTTYWYLSATPKLMEQAAKRLDHTLGVLP